MVGSGVLGTQQVCDKRMVLLCNAENGVPPAEDLEDAALG
jgi:hypothetical protein